MSLLSAKLPANIPYNLIQISVLVNRLERRFPGHFSVLPRKPSPRISQVAGVLLTESQGLVSLVKTRKNLKTERN
ncbi:hypothetical protein CEE34_01075 [Candidatus Aerophobetes bacterium Ae_b3a]|nr:MAG: hypothetical protein CEE34_01075 [Candidatus Aerophobetes bacterium Ae_b3a]